MVTSSPLMVALTLVAVALSPPNALTTPAVTTASLPVVPKKLYSPLSSSPNTGLSPVIKAPAPFCSISSPYSASNPSQGIFCVAKKSVASSTVLNPKSRIILPTNERLTNVEVPIYSKTSFVTPVLGICPPNRSIVCIDTQEP